MTVSLSHDLRHAIRRALAARHPGPAHRSFAHASLAGISAADLCAVIAQDYPQYGPSGGTGGQCGDLVGLFEDVGADVAAAGFHWVELADVAAELCARGLLVLGGPALAPRRPGLPPGVSEQVLVASSMEYLSERDLGVLAARMGAGHVTGLSREAVRQVLARVDQVIARTARLRLEMTLHGEQAQFWMVA